MALKEALTRKLGPAPVWVWVAVGGVGLGLAYRWYKNRQAGTAATTATTTATDSATTAGSDTGSASSPDISGLGGTPATLGGGTSSGGTTDTSGGAGSGDIGFSTGPQPPPAGYTYDQNGNLVTTAQYEDQTVFDRELQLASEGLTVDPATGMIEPFAGGSTVSSPDVPAATTPAESLALAGGPNTATGGNSTPSGTLGTVPTAPPVATIPSTTTAPAAHETLASGTVLWHGTSVPNLQTIATRYGIPISSLKVTTAGPAYGSGVHVVSVV